MGSHELGTMITAIYDRPWLRRVLHELNMLARNRDPSKASWQTAKKAILDAATYLRYETEQTIPPIRLDPIKQLFHINEGALLHSRLASEALVVPTAGGFILRLRENLHSYRRRFSIAHEIGHTFFYDISRDPPTRLVSHATSGGFSKKEEGVCSAFAVELLLPRDLLLADLQVCRYGELETILNFSRRYEVSAEAVVRTLMSDVSYLETCVAIFKAGHSQLSSTSSKRIWWYRGKAIRNYIRKGEAELFRKVIGYVNDDSAGKDLEQLAAQQPDILSLVPSDLHPGSQLVALITFRR